MLEDVRDQGLYFAAVGGVLFAEFFGHELLFGFGFEMQAHGDDGQGQDRADFADGDYGACERNEETCVDRVADDCVWAGADEFVVLLNRDTAAPVAAQVKARPNCEGDSKDREREAGVP
jgi:hypothetical protein